MAGTRPGRPRWPAEGGAWHAECGASADAVLGGARWLHAGEEAWPTPSGTHDGPGDQKLDALFGAPG